jgi:MshEN domain
MHDPADQASPNSEDRRRALELALETDTPYTGLRDFTPDYKLFHYLPATVARSEQVVPLLLIGDSLKVAAARPDPDLTVIQGRFPALTVDIVIAPAAEIAAALERMQPEVPR